MKSADKFQKEYDALKASIITRIWFNIKDRENKTLEIMEEKNIPAIVVHEIDDQESETITELVVREYKVFAIANSYYDDVNEYDLEEFEVPFLIAIYDSVVKHIELEETE